MGTFDTLSVDKFDVSVEQTPDSLTYTIAPRDQPKRTPLVVASVVVVPFGYPLATLAIVVYALFASSADRPAWEVALTGLFILQLGAWLILMGWLIYRMVSGPRLNPGVVLAFTGEGVRHGSDRVCELAAVRGLRLFVYPLSGDPPGHLRAALSLVIGDEHRTHGLLGRLDATDLRTLADDMQRRLATFRSDQGLMSALDPLSVIETTREEAARLISTHSPVIRTLRGRLGRVVAKHPWWVVSAWGLMMIGGLFGSAQLILATGLPPICLAGHMGVALIHLLLLFHWVKSKARQ